MTVDIEFDFKIQMSFLKMTDYLFNFRFVIILVN